MTRAIRVGMVEDSESERRALRRHLAEYQQKNNVAFTITEYGDGYELVEHFQPNFDVLFMDIEMEGLDGLRAAEAVRKSDSKVIIIFVTNMSQYATKGYAVDALSYLVKPVQYHLFAAEMDRCIRQLERVRRESLLVGSGSQLRRVDVADIVYAESIKHTVVLHTVGDEISYSGTLKALESDLGEKGFFRSNNCYLLNLQHVVGVAGEDAAMSDGSELKISRSRKKGLMGALTQYLGGRLV